MPSIGSTTTSSSGPGRKCAKAKSAVLPDSTPWRPGPNMFSGVRHIPQYRQARSPPHNKFPKHHQYQDHLQDHQRQQRRHQRQQRRRDFRPMDSILGRRERVHPWGCPRRRHAPRMSGVRCYRTLQRQQRRRDFRLFSARPNRAHAPLASRPPATQACIPSGTCKHSSRSPLRLWPRQPSRRQQPSAARRVRVTWRQNGE